MNVFLDTNVLLDVLGERQPFFDESARVWSLAESDKIQGMVSPITCANIYHIMRRHANRNQADKAMRLIRDIFHVVPCDQGIINQAIDAGLTDFEDAIQLFCAVHAKAVYLITRDSDHFPNPPLPVLSPGEFLGVYLQQRT